MGEAKPPKGLGAAGRALWRSITGGFELEQHELLVLRQAAVVADRIASLDALVDAEGVVNNQGTANVALIESRQQRVLLARLLAALKLPDQLGKTPQHRGMRGFYGPTRLPDGA